ncbi:MAG: sulfur carrier protein ThiS adenylyltransferase ThiF [Desulfobacteraceae bacterium]|nr:sulfur carrier protein ThiS adenylyltransferase ThiF [Desulfobacteraceae bacterium]
MLKINELPFLFTPGVRVGDFSRTLKPGADLFIVNGAPVGVDWPLADGDSCWLLTRGEIPAAHEMERLLNARHSPGVQARLKAAVVGIMGLGGLGSAVAVALARIGVGRLLLVDCDVVEPTNLNRQQYFLDQIGLPKTEALQANLARINPYVQVETWQERLTGERIAQLFAGVDVLAECFDDPVTKAVALRTALTCLQGVGFVCASGMAGCGDNNAIVTRRLYPGVFLVGDDESEAKPGQGLMAPRVGIAAHHQANQVVRLLLYGKDA